MKLNQEKVSTADFLFLFFLFFFHLEKEINLIIISPELVYCNDSCLFPHLSLLGWAYWIDVYQCDGNLLTAGGDNKNVKIFDKRKSKFVQTFDGIHEGNIFFNKSLLTSNCYLIGSVRCIRWSPSGDMIASTSRDQTVALLDLKTGKKLFTGKTSDGSKFSLFD